MEWEVKELGTMVNEFRTLYEPNKNESLPYIGYEHINQQTLQLISVGSSSEVLSTKKLFDKDCILFGTLRPYFRKLYRPTFNGICSTDLAVLKTTEKAEKNFIFYFLANKEFIDFASNGANGTKMPRATWKVLAKSKWKFPPLPIQQKIASILSAYDDLIENNNRRIALLEKISENLYNEWFVRMRFPGYEKAKFVNGLPEGWEEKKLKDITSFIGRGITPIYNEDSNGIVINQKCIRDSKITLKEAKNQSKKVPIEKLVKFGDILINSTGEGTLGRVAQSFLKIDNLTVDSHVTIVRSSTINFGYLGMVLTKLQYLFEGLAQGSTGQTELGRGDIGNIVILIPQERLINDFSKIYLNIQKNIQLLLQKNTLLRQSRDRLLPQLISGKLSVEHLVKADKEGLEEWNIAAEPLGNYKKK